MLNNWQTKFLQVFAKSRHAEFFYFTGGTMLTEVYLSHRLSEDLDFFSDTPFGYSDVAGFVELFAKKSGIKDIEAQVLFDRRLFFLRKGKESLKLEFTYFPHPRIGRRQVWPNYKINIDSLEDLTANKMLACFDRREPKDIFDLYFIFDKQKWSIEKALGWVKRKFDLSISPSNWLGSALIAAERLERIRPLTDLKEKEFTKLNKDIKTFFEDSVRNLVK